MDLDGSYGDGPGALSHREGLRRAEAEQAARNPAPTQSRQRAGGEGIGANLRDNLLQDKDFLLPLPLGEGWGEGLCGPAIGAWDPHPSPLPEGEGTRQLFV